MLACNMARKNNKNEIIESAKKILSEQGYQKLKMRAVAKGAGIKAASIYNHFKEKEELIYELIFQGRVALASQIGKEIDSRETAIEKIGAFFDEYVKFGFANPEYYKIMFMNSYPESALERIKNEVAREIEPGLKTLASLITDCAKISYDDGLVLAESFFHMVHGHVSLSILQRADFLFNVAATQAKIKEIIVEHLQILAANKNY